MSSDCSAAFVCQSGHFTHSLAARLLFGLGNNSRRVTWSTRLSRARWKPGLVCTKFLLSRHSLCFAEWRVHIYFYLHLCELGYKTFDLILIVLCCAEPARLPSGFSLDFAACAIGGGSAV